MSGTPARSPADGRAAPDLVTVTWTVLPDGSRLPVNDDPFISLEAAALKLHVTTGHIRELIQAGAVRSKVVRLVEERWLVEHYIVSAVDLEGAVPVV